MSYKRLKRFIFGPALHIVLFHNLYSRKYQDQLAACLIVAIIEMTHSLIREEL